MPETIPVQIDGEHRRDRCVKRHAAVDRGVEAHLDRRIVARRELGRIEAACRDARHVEQPRERPDPIAAHELIRRIEAIVEPDRTARERVLEDAVHLERRREAHGADLLGGRPERTRRG